MVTLGCEDASFSDGSGIGVSQAASSFEGGKSGDGEEKEWGLPADQMQYVHSIYLGSTWVPRYMASLACSSAKQSLILSISGLL